MRLTKEDGAILLGAIDAEIESQYWRRLRRSEYGNGWAQSDCETRMQEKDAARAEQLLVLRDKIRSQLKGR